MKQAVTKQPVKKNPSDIASIYLADAMAIQSELLRKLSNRGINSLIDMGELMEDIGNRYLDVAEAIRQNILNGSAARPVPSSDEETNGKPNRSRKHRG